MKLYQCSECKKVFIVNHNQVNFLARCPDCYNEDKFPDVEFICDIN